MWPYILYLLYFGILRRLRDNDDAAVVLSDGLGQRVDGLDVLKEARFRFRVSLQLATIKTRILRAIPGDSDCRVCTWVGLTLFSSFHYLPRSTWADWSLAELAVQLGKMAEHPNQRQPNPGAQPSESPCTLVRKTDSQKVKI